MFAIGCVAPSPDVETHGSYDRTDPRAQLDPALVAVPAEPSIIDEAGPPAPRPGRTVLHDLITHETVELDEPRPSDRTSALAASHGLASVRGLARDGNFAQVEQFVRTNVIDTTAWPARANVKLYSTYPNGQRFSCSGAMIGDRFVLTAGHCVWNKERGGWASTVTVIPGLDGTYTPFGDALAINISSVTAYTKDGDKSADHALLTLDRRLGNTVGWFGVRAASDGELDGDALVMNGYPAESYPGYIQVGVTGTAESNSNSMVYYTLESEGGFSGSGVLRAGTDYVSAVNTRSNCYAFPLTFSRACGVRINADRLNRITGWINERAGWPATEADQTGWMDLWGETYGEITPVQSGARAVDLLVRGTDGAVWRQHWDPTTQYTGWVALGGTPAPQGTRTGRVAAVSRRSGQLDLFILGSDGAIWTKASSSGWPGNPWPSGIDWYSLGGALVDAPAATSWGTSRLDVFARGSDNRLWWQFWAGSGWSGWLPLGGPVLTGAPAAVSWGNGRLDVVIRQASDGGLVHYACAGACTTAAAWSAPAVIEGAVFPPDSRPILVTTGAGNLDVFVRGYPGDVWTVRLRGSAWQGWYPIGGALLDDIGAARRGDSIELVVRGTDRAIYSGTVASADGSFSGFRSIGGSSLGTPTALSLDPTTLDVYMRDSTNRTRTRAWTVVGGWAP